MQHSTQERDRPKPVAQTFTLDDGMRALELLPRIGDADSTETAVTLFREAVICLGADAGVFMSHLRDDATRASLRSLWACDPVWAAEYANRRLFENDPWLQYATHESEPILASALNPTSAEHEVFQAAAASYGFASAVIAPAPSGVGTSRVGVLCLGSQQPGYFEAVTMQRSASLHGRWPWSFIGGFSDPSERICFAGRTSAMRRSACFAMKRRATAAK